MSTTVNLGALGSAGFIIQGDTAFDRAGLNVASAGDVNGDGFDDLIVGAPGGDDTDGGAGEAYVIFGKASGFGTVDLSSLAPGQGFIIQGATASDNAGTAVASAGDINGDGYDDMIVGAPFAGADSAGGAYVLYGKPSGFGTVQLASLTPDQGFAIVGEEGGDWAGFSVASAGDVNGDTIDDFIVGAPYFDEEAGAAYILFGRTTGFDTIDLAALTADQGFSIEGDFPIDWTGRRVSSAGDINNDGYDDILIGTPYDDSGGANAGQVALIFGRADGFANIEMSALTPDQGFFIQGDIAYDQAGVVSGAGDVNGDGFDDFLVGAPIGDAGNGPGTAYLIFGKAGGFADIDLSTLTLDQGFAIRGETVDDEAGRSVAGAGDVNGDGFDDILVGAPLNDAGGNQAGAAYVLYGKASGFGTLDLVALTNEQGFRIQGDSAVDRAGFHLASAGDVNHDGFADLIIGAPGGDDGGTDAGEAYILFGAAPTTSVTRIGSATGQTIRGGSGDDYLAGLGGDDSLFGAAGADELRGGDGRDRLDSGGGRDQLDGGDGNDIYFVRTGDIVVETATGGHDLVKARSNYVLNREADVDILSTANSAGVEAINLTGNQFDNRIIGNAGDNVLKGWLGSDVLLGNAGADRFVFNAVLGPANVDVILDFAVGEDEIGLDDAIFAAVGPTFNPREFVIGSAAGDGDDRIIYDSATGALFFDADGSGAEAAVQFATLDSGLALTASDFVVI